MAVQNRTKEVSFRPGDNGTFHPLSSLSCSFVEFKVFSEKGSASFEVTPFEISAASVYDLRAGIFISPSRFWQNKLGLRPVLR